MFDDLDNNKNQSGDKQSVPILPVVDKNDKQSLSSASISTSNNSVPVSKVEQAPVPNTSFVPLANGPKVEDMFSETDKSKDKPDIFQPKQPGTLVVKESDSKDVPNNKNNKKIFILFLSIVGILVIGVGSFLGYKFFISVKDGIDTDNTIENDNVVENLKIDNGDDKVLDKTLVDVSKDVDTDNDGLTDKEEEAAGSDINKVDTDDDGLTDAEEVKIYMTNPTNEDTDNDGTIDGAEVKNAMNPNGPGRLYKSSNINLDVNKIDTDNGNCSGAGTGR